MKNIKVSIIVPVYNVEKYIDKCLNSLVNQTLKEIEIIVVNDGSPDNSQTIIDAYVKKYPKKVKSFIKENGGQGSARNFGLKYAAGKYIGYVDSDDFVEKDMYEKLYNKAEKSNYDIVFCENYAVDENTLNKEKEINYDKSFSLKENAFFGKLAVWNKIYKKNLISDNNLKFKEKVWYEDTAFTIKAMILAKKIGYTSKSYYNYLIREGSTMNNSNVKRNLEIKEAFDNINDFLKSNNLVEEYHDIVEFLAIKHIYLSTIVRIINASANTKMKNECIRNLKEYMNVNYFNYKNNNYINTLSKNKKIIFYLINNNMYDIVKIIFRLKKGIQK